MSLTSIQAQTLKSTVSSDATVSNAVAQHDWFTVAANYNAPSATVIWRKDVLPSQIQSGIVVSEADKQSAQVLQCAQLLLSAPVIDATQITVRQQFVDMFPVSSCASTIANLTAIAQRDATKFESLFVVSQVSSVYGYVLSPLDVQTAMGF